MLNSTTENESVYLKTLARVCQDGWVKPNRTGVDTRQVFGGYAVYNLLGGFPLLTTKKMAITPIIGELIGFLNGYDNAEEFRDLGCNIWDANANENEDWLKSPHRCHEDDLGRIYGVQWREWHAGNNRFIDQMEEAIWQIKETPDSRRIIITAWNPAELDEMCLPPCHCFMQFNVDGNCLDLSFYQRSCDMFLGMPFNIASYALLLMIIARITGKVPRQVHHFMGDMHVYETHTEQVGKQLTRAAYLPPQMVLPDYLKSLDDFPKLKPEDFKVIGYRHHRALCAPMAV